MVLPGDLISWQSSSVALVRHLVRPREGYRLYERRSTEAKAESVRRMVPSKTPLYRSLAHLRLGPTARRPSPGPTVRRTDGAARSARQLTGQHTISKLHADLATASAPGRFLRHISGGPHQSQGRADRNDCAIVPGLSRLAFAVVPSNERTAPPFAPQRIARSRASS